MLPFDEGAICDGDRTMGAGERASLLFYLPDAIAPWPAQSVRWALAYAVGSSAVEPIAATRSSAVSTSLPILDSPIGTLSKGQRKRALLAMGVLTSPPLLLLHQISGQTTRSFGHRSTARWASGRRPT